MEFLKLKKSESRSYLEPSPISMMDRFFTLSKTFEWVLILHLENICILPLSTWYGAPFQNMFLFL